MHNLKLIAKSFIVLYILFILINVLELFWNGFLFFDSHKMDFLSSLIKIEKKVHYCANIFDYALQCVFLLFMNHFVKKNEVGKGYHFLIILLAFVPLVNWFLLYIIWRKLNQAVFTSFGTNPMRSDRKIVFIWILILTSLIIAILMSVILFYSKSPELVSLVNRLEGLGPVVRSVFLLFVSFTYLFYFLEFNSMVSDKTPEAVIIRENQLLDH
ncbi:hypothetical protein D3C71_439560 [compost metagenome]